MTVADVGILDGRIAEVGPPGTVAGTGRTIDVSGALVTPGFVDPHTHFDAQLLWDPWALPSSMHGVTTVIGGNCGFGLAPAKKRDGDYLRQLLARVEGMSLNALEREVGFEWDGFGGFLDRLEGRIGVNAAFGVGHSSIRRFVLGDEAHREEVTDDELGAMQEVLRSALAAGGLGFSTSQSNTHTDGQGDPVPSRSATRREILELCKVVGEFPGTSLEAIVSGCLRSFSDDEVELLADMSAVAGRTLNWNVLTVEAAHEQRAYGQLSPSRRARELGGRVVALTMPVHAEMTMSFNTYCGLWAIPGWTDILSLPVPARAARLRDVATREWMVDQARGTALERFTDFPRYEIGETFHPDNALFENHPLSEVAASLGVEPFEALVEVLVRDEFQTVLWPPPAGDTDADWALRARFWEEGDVLIGGSDAGAHIDRTLGANYPSRFLADSIHGRQLVSVERAVQLMTSAPADLFGLKDRGRLRVGSWADVVVVDPGQVGSEPIRRIVDPEDGVRLTAASRGIKHVFVNGQETITSGEHTGAINGTLLRAGRDT